MMFHDHHIHPFGYAEVVNGLTLMEEPDLGSVLQSVAAHGERREGPIVGLRLNDEGLKELRLPTAAEIDDVIPDRPVLLYRYCGHIAVANSAALALAGIDADTSDPEGGAFDRDRSGKPNGILRETAVTPVTQAVEARVTPPTDLEVISALATLRRMGIGSITAMVSAGSSVWCGVEDEIGTLIRIGPDLPVDIDCLIMGSEPDDIVSAKERLDQAQGPLRWVGYKDFTDGSLGGHTAAMYEPFSDKPETRGMERFNHDHLVEMGKTATELGGQVAIHAIGDRANDLVLDVHEELIGDGADPSNLRVEHASILTSPTIEKMANLGIIASIQPAFLASEETWLHKRLGDDRMSRAYPFKSMMEAGVPLIGGSDSPVELPDPETGIRAAVNRHGIGPDEALSVEDATALFAPPTK